MLAAGAALVGAAAILAARGGPARASHDGTMWVDGKTDVWVQNIDPEQLANIFVDFYPEAGDPPPPREVARQLQALAWPPTALQPGNSMSFRSPATAEGLGELGRYAVIAHSNRCTAGISRTVEPFTGAAVAYNNIEVGNSIIVPLVALGFSQPTDISSIISVQSTEKTPRIPINATLFSKTYHLITPGREPVYATVRNSPVAASLPDTNTGGTWFVDAAEDFALPVNPNPPGPLVGTFGWVRIQAPPGRPADPAQRFHIGAQSSLNLRTVNTAVSAHTAVSESHKARTLYVPLFRYGFPLSPWETTGISVVNPGPSPVRVRLTYFGSDLPGHACQGQTVVHRDAAGQESAITIPANDSAVFFQIKDNPDGNIGAPGNTGDANLPLGCFGSAMIEVQNAQGGPAGPNDGVIAMVNDFSVDARGRALNASAFAAVRPEDTSTRVAVPMLRHDRTVEPGQTLPRVATSIQVMNVHPTDRPANVTVRFYPKARDYDAAQSPGPSPVLAGPVTQAVRWRRAHTFWSGAIPGIRDQVGFEGAAVIESDARVAVVVTIHEFGADSVSYNGIKADQLDVNCQPVNP